MRHLILIPALLLAAGCDNSPGTNFSIDTTTNSGEAVTARADGDNGRVSIAAPGFKASVVLPKIHLDAADMDIDGLKLFPGSKVSGMSVFADDSASKGEGKVHIAFDAPADPAAVRSWFTKQMTDKGFTVRASANGLSGTTKDAKPLTLDLKPGAAGHTQGMIAITDSD